MLISELPHELISEIYRLLYDQVNNTQLIKNPIKRRQWSLQLLSTCMVCQTWYTAGSEYLSMRFCTRPYISLNSLISTVECPTSSSTHLLDWNNLLMESKQNSLHFHRLVRQLAVDLSSFINPSNGGGNNNSSQVQVNGKDHSNTEKALMSSKELEDLAKSIKIILDTCINLETLEILYDPQYTDNQQSAQMLNVLSTVVSDTFMIHDTSIATSTMKSTCLSRLVFKTRESMERCPCCAGRGWDHLLVPLLHSLPTTTLVLDHVLPSRSVLECLCKPNQIDTLVIRGDILTQTSRFTRYSSSVSSSSRIPLELLSQLHTLEIYLYSQMDDDQKQQQQQQQQQQYKFEDDDMELYLLMTFRQIYDIIQPIKSLQRLVIHGKKNNEISLDNQIPDYNLDQDIINKDIWSKMELLAERQHLNCVILENIPGFQCPSAQSKLRNLFENAGKNNVVYIT